eukprot:m51a1_g10986 hypothetical protein (329) ;mRNA; r:319888-321131
MDPAGLAPGDDVYELGEVEQDEEEEPLVEEPDPEETPQGDSNDPDAGLVVGDDSDGEAEAPAADGDGEEDNGEAEDEGDDDVEEGDDEVVVNDCENPGIVPLTAVPLRPPRPRPSTGGSASLCTEFSLNVPEDLRSSYEEDVRMIREYWSRTLANSSSDEMTLRSLRYSNRVASPQRGSPTATGPKWRPPRPGDTWLPVERLRPAHCRPRTASVGDYTYMRQTTLSLQRKADGDEKRRQLDGAGTRTWTPGGAAARQFSSTPPLAATSRPADVPAKFDQLNALSKVRVEHARRKRSEILSKERPGHFKTGPVRHAPVPKHTIALVCKR